MKPCARVAVLLSRDALGRSQRMPRFNVNKPKRSLEDINREIYEIESQMQSPGLQPHIKASLKKKFISLIRERANVDK